MMNSIDSNNRPSGGAWQGDPPTRGHYLQKKSGLIFIDKNYIFVGHLEASLSINEIISFDDHLHFAFKKMIVFNNYAIFMLIIILFIIIKKFNKIIGTDFLSFFLYYIL